VVMFAHEEAHRIAEKEILPPRLRPGHYLFNVFAR
jgi:hypothetical protein